MPASHVLDRQHEALFGEDMLQCRVGLALVIGGAHQHHRERQRGAERQVEVGRQPCPVAHRHEDAAHHSGREARLEALEQERPFLVERSGTIRYRVVGSGSEVEQLSHPPSPPGRRATRLEAAAQPYPDLARAD